MIYQQEMKEINTFYSKYKDKKIVYSKEVTQDIGLIQKETVVKVGTSVIKGALISSTMESLVVLAKLNDQIKQEIFNQNGSLSVQLKFIMSDTGKSLVFTIHTKFLNINNQGLDQEDMQFISMQIRRKIPNDLIRVFGLFHEKATAKLKIKKSKVECILLANEQKYDCLIQSITKKELVLVLNDSSIVEVNQKVIAILKVVKTGEVLEIIGTVVNKVSDSDKNYEISLQYDMEDQSPRFNYSIHVLKTLINT